jgi:nuclear pore complex protein Nup107
MIDEVAQYRNDQLFDEEEMNDEQVEEQQQHFPTLAFNHHHHHQQFNNFQETSSVLNNTYYTGQTIEEKKFLTEKNTQLDDQFYHHNIDPSFRDSVKVASVYLELIHKYIESVDSRLQQVQDIEERSGDKSHEFQLRIAQESQLIRTEKHTWQLLYNMFDDLRQHQTRIDNKHIHEVALNKIRDSKQLWRASHKDIATFIFETREDVRIQQLVIQWLESIPETENGFDAPRLATWCHTKQQLTKPAKHQDQKSGKLVTALDPDAPTRENAFLASDDQEKEEALLRTIWKYLRSGRLKEAQEYCRASGQYWRAATIAGAEYYHNLLSVGNNANTIQPTEANRNRFVYCHTLLKHAKESTNKLQRAIYGVLCGDLTSMLEACDTWEDYLWAYLKANVSSEFNKLLKNYIDQHSEDASYVQNVLQSQSEILSLDQIIYNLRNHADEKVRNEAKQPYHMTQSYIMQDQIRDLLHYLCNTAFNETNYT